MASEQAISSASGALSRFYETDGLKLHYLDWDGNPESRTFVLLHGGSAHAHWWDTVAPRLTECGRVLALDFRGHGRSQWAGVSHYGPRAYVRDVLGLIKTLGASRVVLVGHSMGGAVAQWVALEDPEMLEALIVVDAPNGPPPLRTRLMWRWRRRARGRVRPELESADAIVKRFRLSPPGTYLAAPDLARLALEGAEQLPNGRWAFRFDPQTRAWRRHGGQMKRPRIGKITIPTLILRGAQSSMVSARHARRMHRKIHGSKLIEIPRAYHHVPLDNPEATAEAISAFVESI